MSEEASIIGIVNAVNKRSVAEIVIETIRNLLSEKEVSWLTPYTEPKVHRPLC